MRYIYQIYLDGSFTKAAKSLYITQPALSMTVQKVEAELGMPIFDRSTRPFSLTHAGHIYINTIKEMMLLEENLHKHIDDIRNLQSGSLVIGGTHYLNAYILPDILNGFHVKYPGIDLQIVEESSPALVRMLEESQLDLYFSCDPKLISSYPGHKSFSDQILLAVPKSFSINHDLTGAALTAEDVCSMRHLQSEHPSISLAGFNQVAFLLLFEGSNLYERANAMFLEAGMSPNIIKMHLSQSATAFRLACSGLGATFVVDRMVEEKDDSLFYYKINSVHAARTNYILQPKRKYTTEAMNAFIRFLADRQG